MLRASLTYVFFFSSFNPQVITPIRSGQGYVYEFPSNNQKDIYDIPPVHPLQGVSIKKPLYPVDLSVVLQFNFRIGYFIPK